MKKVPLQAAFRVLRVGHRVTGQDMRAMPRRDLSLIGLARCELAQADSCAPDRFYDAMAGHCADIVQLHNLKLSSERGSPRHAKFQQLMRDAVRRVVGDAPFDCFGPNFGQLWSKAELPGPDCAPSFETEAIWSCYWIVVTIEMLAHEVNDDATWLVGSYIQSLFRWWLAVQAHGSEAINAAIYRHPMLSN